MKIDLKKLERKSFWVSLSVATLFYFPAIWLFQSWYYSWRGIDQRPEGLFKSFGPQFFQAEPLEIYLYFAAYLMVPLTAFFIMPAVEKLIQWIKLKKINWKLIIFIVSGLVVVTGAIVFFRLPLDVYYSYFERAGFKKALWLLTTKRLFSTYLILILTGLFFIGFWYWGDKRFDWRGFRDKVLNRNKINYIAPLMFLLLTVLIFHPNYPIDEHHYNYFIGAVNDVQQGKPILYETSHLYGLFNIYFLNLVFQILPFSFASLNLVVSFFYLLFFAGIFFFIRKWFQSDRLAVLGTIVIFAIIYLFQTSPTRSALFFPNMSPFRLGWYILPLFFILAFQRNRSKRWLHLSLIVSALTLFWNFDSGLFLSLAVLGTFGYELAVRGRIKSVFALIGQYLLYVGGVFLLVNVFNRAIFHAWPDWALFFRETKYFVMGAGMYPLPPVGFYQIFFFVYLSVMLAGLMYVFRKIKLIEPVPLFLALYGTFSMIYYVGESTWQLLYVVTVPFVLLMLYGFVRFDKWRIVRAGFASLLVFSLLLLVFKLPVEFSNRDYARAGTDFTLIPEIHEAAYQDARFIKENFTVKRIPLISHNDTRLLLYAGKANWFDFYYMFTIYFEDEMQSHVDKVLDEKPDVILIGKKRNDQINYFVSGIDGLYEKQQSLQTVDIYVIKN